MSDRERQPITYASTGVNYDAMDPLKRLAQMAAAETSGNIERFGFKVVELSRGESAFIIDEGDRYSAHVIEGLGTKNLVAEQLMEHLAIATATEEATGLTHYDKVAQCTVAMGINDLITVGADPVLVNAYWAAGDSSWFENLQRAQDLVNGWKRACNLAGAVWGGGETPTLRGIINPNTVDLSCSAYGVIKPKERLTLGDKIAPGDVILLVKSSGIHANGLTLARKVSTIAPEGYASKLSDGTTYGEALLAPTHIYASLVRDLFEAGIDIHYMINITGHGWRKLMRAERDFTYRMHSVPPPHPVFDFIQTHSNNTDEEMYGNFNEGAGFALVIPAKDVKRSQRVARVKHGLGTLAAGVVEEGPRRVIIEPKGIEFVKDTLGVR